VAYSLLCGNGVEEVFLWQEVKMHLSDVVKSPAEAIRQDAWPALEWGAEFWMNLFDEIDSPVLVYRPEGRLVWANREAAGLLGLEGLEGQLMPERLHSLVRGGARLEAYSHGREIAVPSEDGTESRKFVLKHLSSGRPGGLILASAGARGGPESPEPQRRLSFGDQMTLAGEVSRNVKGPLAGIELYASILGEELDGAGDGALSAILDEIRYSVREVNEYLTSLESMTRPLTLDLRSWNVTDLVDEALEALNGLFKSKGIGVLVEQLDMTVECDRGLMVQTFLNILLNAVEAMPRGGRLIVRAEMNRAGECEVTVTDSGPGVATLDARKLFNPFYTTKNQTLGLGLPVSRRIVEAHQGRIVFGNDEVLGARVKVTLPCFPGGSGTGNYN
jgi:signal transduction histidine kinase